MLNMDVLQWLEK